jgi:A/G-specific adenine glycosylase
MIPLSPARKNALVQSLLEWYRENGRDFPWRESFTTPDPYAVLFTEIMLQRTKADQVAPVYEEFLKRYPSFDKLFAAPSQDVIALFSRLGLKWRAKSVIKLIKALKKMNGIVPDDLHTLRQLPGVGDYVAAAVLCYAFGENTAPVDANVVRVISRLFGMRITSDAGRRNQTLRETVESLVPEEKPRDFNLAMLDFAAMVCKPKPLCVQCPLGEDCIYYAESKQILRARSWQVPTRKTG